MTALVLAIPGAAWAAEESGPPQPEAAIGTRTCEQNGALVTMTNLGGGSVAFQVLVDNEPSGSYTVGPGSIANHLVPIREDQTVGILVTAEGMAPVAGMRQRDCGGASPGAADAAAGATDPVDTVPAGTPPPAEAPAPAVAGASAGPEAATAAPAADPVPAGTLPFTGVGAGELAALTLLGAMLAAGGAQLHLAAQRARVRRS